MNYPSLCLSSELIEKAFSKRNAAPQKRSPTRIIPQHGPKANISEPLNQPNFENGEIKDCDNCDYKTLTYEDLFNHIKLTHMKKGIKHKCPLCDFSNNILSRVKKHFFEVHLKIGEMKKM